MFVIRMTLLLTFRVFLCYSLTLPSSMKIIYPRSSKRIKKLKGCPLPTVNEKVSIREIKRRCFLDLRILARLLLLKSIGLKHFFSSLYVSIDTRFISVTKNGYTFNIVFLYYFHLAEQKNTRGGH